MEPVKVFVSPGHLDVIELKYNKPSDNILHKLGEDETYTWGQLVCNVTLKTFELGFLLRGCYHTGVGRGGSLPAVLPVTLVLE